jgi:DNA mismatch repair protein, C-terminal domain
LGQQLYPVQATQGVVSLEGSIADPACERGGGGLQYWFVNGRWVRDRALSQALHEAYLGLLSGWGSRRWAAPATSTWATQLRPSRSGGILEG